jgi:hypothetical protein
LFTISPALATVIPMTSATFTGGIDGSGNITNTTQITSFTTTQGTVSTLVGATSVTSVTGGLDLDRNAWGNAGTESNGATSLMGLDASTGAVQINTANFFFGQTVQAGNDIFILDVGTTDPLTVNPIDISGTLIGTFSLSIIAADWGTLATSTANLDALVNPANNSGLNVGNPANDLAVNGLAFDLSDFVGTGTLSGVAGIRIAGGGTFDPVVVGFVPEPSTVLLLAMGLTGLALRRRLAA